MREAVSRPDTSRPKRAPRITSLDGRRDSSGITRRSAFFARRLSVGIVSEGMWEFRAGEDSFPQNPLFAVLYKRHTIVASSVQTICCLLRRKILMCLTRCVAQWACQGSRKTWRLLATKKGGEAGFFAWNFNGDAPKWRHFEESHVTWQRRVTK